MSSLFLPHCTLLSFMMKCPHQLSFLFYINPCDKKHTWWKHPTRIGIHLFTEGRYWDNLLLIATMKLELPTLKSLQRVTIKQFFKTAHSGNLLLCRNSVFWVAELNPSSYPFMVNMGRVLVTEISVFPYTNRHSNKRCLPLPNLYFYPTYINMRYKEKWLY